MKYSKVYSIPPLYHHHHQLIFLYIIAEDIDTHRHYAIKREPLDTPFSQLRHESIMYDVLAGGRKCCLLLLLLLLLSTAMMVTHVMLYNSWYSPMPVVWRTR